MTPPAHPEPGECLLNYLPHKRFPAEVEHQTRPMLAHANRKGRRRLRRRTSSLRGRETGKGWA